MLATRNMKLYLPFERNANDFSGNGNNGTVYGATLEDGKFGKCLSFDGVDDYVSIPQVNFAVGNTLIMKAYLYDITTTGYIFGGGGLYGIRYNGISLLAINADSGFTTINYTKIDAFITLAITRPYTNKVNWYINSDYLGQTSCGSSNNLNINLIGRRGSGSFYYSRVKLDNIQLYDKLISVTDLKRIHLGLHPLNG